MAQVSKEIIIGIAAVLVAFMLVTSEVGPTSEGFRPFAWYGYPGASVKTVGYQSRGDWCGIEPATRTVDAPLPIIAPKCT
jgi:hypothetical protein